MLKCASRVTGVLLISLFFFFFAFSYCISAQSEMPLKEVFTNACFAILRCVNGRRYDHSQKIVSET